MSLALLFHYLLLNVFRMLIHPSSGACDLFVELFHGLYCSSSMCVGVTLWFGWCGVVSGCRLQPAYYQDDARSNKHKIPVHLTSHKYLPTSVIRAVLVCPNIILHPHSYSVIFLPNKIPFSML